MGDFIVEFSDRRTVVPSTSPAILVDPTMVSQLGEWFPGWLALYDRGSHPLVARHVAMRDWHHDPLPSTIKDRIGPFMNELGPVETLASSVAGSSVLVLRSLGGTLGTGWYLGRVLCDEDAVLLSGDKRMACDTPAVAVADRESVLALDFVLAADGSPYRVSRKAAPVRLPSFCGRRTTLGQLAREGARSVLLEVSPAPTPKWTYEELGT